MLRGLRKIGGELQFGLQAGHELAVVPTIWQTFHPLFISNVFRITPPRAIPTSAFSGFESCVSMPIVLANGNILGALAAIDERPSRLCKFDCLEVISYSPT